jgi:Kef-type K+ transport system membrane component KefB
MSSAIDLGSGRPGLPSRRWPRPLLVAFCAAAILAALGAGAAFSAATGFRATGPLPELLLVLPLVLLACRAAGRLSERLGQPAVIGEILAGVLLGPSLFGWLWPTGFGRVFPAALSPSVNLVAQLGLALFVFLVGYDLDLQLVRQRLRATFVVSQVSLVIPFAAGLALAFGAYGLMAGGSADRITFALFLAVSMSVTAFPVLARILRDRGLDTTPIGSIALASAAVGDVAAWIMLAVVITMAGSTGQAGLLAHEARTIALLAGFVLALAAGVRPVLARLVRSQALPQPLLTLILVAGILLSALATQEMGLHPIFGAFLFGAVTPARSAYARAAVARLRGWTALVLPVFFVATGLRTKFGLLGTEWRIWAWLLLLIAVAVASKLIATAVAARATGVSGKDSVRLGILMNCRGLTELVVLSTGLSLNVINPTGFALLVLVTLVTTLGTVPALSLVARLGPRRPAGTVQVPVESS